MSIGKMLTIFLVFLLIFISARCTTEEQKQLKAIISLAGKTAIAEGENFVQTQGPKIKSTGEVIIASRVANVESTSKAKIGTEIANMKSTLLPKKLEVAIKPPYDACTGKTTKLSSPLSGSDKIIEQGFAQVSYSCNKDHGTLNNTLILFGGKNGSILDPPSYKADVTSVVEHEFIPTFTGDLRIDAVMFVSSDTGAAAGSSLALPDIRDVILSFLLPTKIGAFLDISRNLIFQTAAGVKTDAYIYVDTAMTRNETFETIGGHGYGASFPVPPYSQSAKFTDKKVSISYTTPVKKGEKLFIGVGIKTTGLTHGWAIAYWNPGGKEEVFIETIRLIEE